MRGMSGLMKKTIFAIAVILAAVSFLPNTAEAATAKLDRSRITVTAKERFTLKVKGVKQKAVWSTSNKKLATVTKKGNVVTKKNGVVTIKAKVGKKTLKCKVTIKEPCETPYMSRYVSDTKGRESVEGKTVTLRVGESTLLIDGEYSDYESVFSFNDRIATVNPDGRVTATGIGTTRILVNRGVDKAGNYRDYYCTINVVAGTAPACKHQWMDADKYSNNGKYKGSAFIQKVSRDEGYTMCNTCGEKFLFDEDLSAHRKEMRDKGTSHNGSYAEGGASVHNANKFGTQYCSKCGLCK